MPLIKAELCLDIGVAAENMTAVFADTKLQMEQSNRKMMGGREWKELGWYKRDSYHSPGLGTQSWRSRIRLDMEERETREVEPNRHEEHRERRVKGEQCRDLGGQSKPWQWHGTRNDEYSYASRKQAGYASVASQLCCPVDQR